MTRSYGQCTFCFRVLPASLHVKLHWHVSQVWILLNTWTKDTILVLEQKTKSSSRSVSYWETTSQLLCIIIRKALWLYELTFIVGKRALEIRYYTNKVNAIKKQAQLSSVLYTFKYTVLKLFAEKSNLNFWSFFFVCFVYLICPNCSVWRNKVIKHLSIKKKKNDFNVALWHFQLHLANSMARVCCACVPLSKWSVPKWNHIPFLPLLGCTKWERNWKWTRIPFRNILWQLPIMELMLSPALKVFLFFVCAFPQF